MRCMTRLSRPAGEGTSRACSTAGAGATAAALAGAHAGNQQAGGCYVQRNVVRYVIAKA
jgi:hypothetical protein